MHTHCIICSSQHHEKKFQCLKECKKCGLISADLNFTRAEIQNIYKNENYFKGGFEGMDYVNYLAEKPALEKNFQKRLSDVIQFTPNPELKSLLEIGAGYGFFLKMAQKKFKTASGIELSPHGCKYALKTLRVNMIHDDFLLCKTISEFDVICMWDTIEHLTDPHLYIKKCFQALNKNGFLHITTGDIGSFNAKLRGAKWRMIHPPTHLFYFSRKSITKLLQNNGFEIKKIKYVGNHRTVDAYLKAIIKPKYRNTLLYKFLKSTDILNKAIPVNLYDIMHVTAKKNDLIKMKSK